MFLYNSVVALYWTAGGSGGRGPPGAAGEEKIRASLEHRSTAFADWPGPRAVGPSPPRVLLCLFRAIACGKDLSHSSYSLTPKASKSSGFEFRDQVPGKKKSRIDASASCRTRSDSDSL